MGLEELITVNKSTYENIPPPPDDHFSCSVKKNSCKHPPPFKKIPGIRRKTQNQQAPPIKSDSACPQAPGSKKFQAFKGVIELVVAPFELKKGEPLRLRVFLDGPMLEVFANDRQAIAQQVFPKRKDTLLIKVFAKGAPATVTRIDAWDMAPAKFVDNRTP